MAIRLCNGIISRQWPLLNEKYWHEEKIAKQQRLRTRWWRDRCWTNTVYNIVYRIQEHRFTVNLLRLPFGNSRHTVERRKWRSTDNTEYPNSWNFYIENCYARNFSNRWYKFYYGDKSEGKRENRIHCLSVQKELNAILKTLELRIMCKKLSTTKKSKTRQKKISNREAICVESRGRAVWPSPYT